MLGPSRRPPLDWRLLTTCWLGWMLLGIAAPSVRAEVALPEFNGRDPISITAEAAHRWQEGSYEVWWLRGNCTLKQGLTQARGAEAVLWIEPAARSLDGINKVLVYLEGDVEIDLVRDQAAARVRDQTWYGRLSTPYPIEMRTPPPQPQPDPEPAVYRRGKQRRQPSWTSPIRRTQYEAVPTPTPQADIVPPGTRRIRVFRRSNVPVQIQVFPSPTADELVAVIDSGVNVLIDGLPEVGALDISTDRIVVWTRGLQGIQLGADTLQSSDLPLEVYLEGNIEFRQGERIIYAQRMYYDVRNHIGMVLDAEVLTPVPNYEGLLRLRSAVVHQLGRDRFLARDTFITSSRLGRPTYRLQARELQFEDHQQPVFDPFTAAPHTVPQTGQPVIHHRQRAVGRDLNVYLGEVPIFYWPVFSTDLQEPTFYLDRAVVRNDRVFGFQILTDWDAYEVFGIENPPEGTQWKFSVDLLTERGLGHGTRFDYDLPGIGWLQGPAVGFLDAWAIHDDGRDNLGLGRRDLFPEKDYRYRVFGRHRQLLADDYILSAELGWISDRNFLEQYYENEWDQLKDQTTGFELKKIWGNMSWSLSSDIRLNDFFTQTEWLPRVDHFWLGQSLLGDRLTWFEHTTLAYARLRTASTPENAGEAAIFGLLPWEVTASGERLITRHEIDVPFDAGPVKIVPYALGELAHWGEDITGSDLSRAYGQLGVRASLPMWTVNPLVENHLFNVHGLAHKVTFQVEASLTDATRDLTELPLYEPLDDDAIEHMRRRMPATTYGTLPGTLPPEFDPRLYALRYGLQGLVTSPAMEIADDFAAVRLGVLQRWQTKRGEPGQRHILDWITLDTHLTWFPEDERDNFGSDFGLLDWDFRWHVGDRVTLLSHGAVDFFDDGQQIYSVGGYLNRPPRGSAYLSYTFYGGPIESQIIALAYTYRLGPKWLSTFGTSFDLEDDNNIGQNFSLTRIGESFLVSLGFNVDSSKNNVGLQLSVEPRFLPRRKNSEYRGAQIPPAGAFGLE